MELYYNSYWAGSHTAFTSSVSNFSGYTFLASGAGQGLSVKNNAASAAMVDYPSHPTNAAIFFNSGYGGACDWFLGHHEGSFTESFSLGPTYNENASFKFTSATGPAAGVSCQIWR